MLGYQEFFRGKKITVMGMGLLGGVGDIRFLAENGADLIVTDLKQESELSPSLEALREFTNIRYTLGRHDLADFQGRDLIIMAPTTPKNSAFIAEARAQGTPITMWAALFSRFAREAGATIVGITGTRGKTTTTVLMAQTLTAAGKQVITGGNVQGTAILSQLPQVTRDTIVVLELDSWKLQGFGEEKLSPDIAVFTTFYPDHLNYYGGDMQAYLADKALIFLNQRPHDTLIIGEQCEKIVQETYEGKIPSHAVVAYGDDVPSDWSLKIPGQHNRDNAACALFTLRILGVGEDDIKKSFGAFTGVEGRLQFVREFSGVKIYNDTTATTPDATIAALRALDPEDKKNIVLIMGGADKELDMTALIKEIPLHGKKVIMLDGTGTQKMAPQLAGSMIYHSIAEAVDAAMAAASAGDIMLLSPAFASFGMFKNEYDRGDQFMKIINSLE